VYSFLLNVGYRCLIIINSRLYPKLFFAKEGYTKHYFLSDLLQALVLGLCTTASGIGLYGGSGVSPERGCLPPIVQDF
jgi:hypothetical protein